MKETNILLARSLSARASYLVINTDFVDFY